MKKILLLVTLIILVGVTGLFVSGKLNLVNNKTSSHVSKKSMYEVKDFSLLGLDGKLLKLSDWNGKIIVLNFWATWCPPCIREIPLLVKMQSIWQDQGVQFVGVAIDSKEKIQQFLKDQPTNYPIMLGQENAIEIAENMGNLRNVLPYTVIINRKGTIIKARAGEVTETMLINAIKPIL